MFQRRQKSVAPGRVQTPDSTACSLVTIPSKLYQHQQLVCTVQYCFLEKVNRMYSFKMFCMEKCSCPCNSTVSAPSLQTNQKPFKTSRSYIPVFTVIHKRNKTLLLIPVMLRIVYCRSFSGVAPANLKIHSTSTVSAHFWYRDVTETHCQKKHERGYNSDIGRMCGNI